MRHLIIEIVYFLTAVLFIIGLKRMSSPKTARSGIVWAGGAMLLAVVATFFWPGLHNFALIIIAVVMGTVIAWVAAKKVSMTDMPQMIAIYNGMGGGAAGCIGAVELLKADFLNPGLMALAIAGSLIGAIAFSGSCIAFGKLQGLMGDRPLVFPAQKIINMVVLGVAIIFGLFLFSSLSPFYVFLFFIFALLFG